MYLNKKIIVVIPCFRVEKHIRQVISSIPEYVDEIIAVNDASDDSTGSLLSQINERRLLIINHKKNQGVGGSMITGFQEALKRNADIIVKVDGDGQMDANQIKRLIHPIASRHCDYTKGNRLKSMHDVRNMPKIRLAGNLILSFLTKFASGYWKVMDPQNGYIAISSKTLSRIDLSKIAKNYFFENSMLIELYIQGAKIADVSMPAIYGTEASSLKIRRIILEFPIQLIKSFFRRLIIKNCIRDLSPYAVFLFFGLLMFIPGLLLGLKLYIKALLIPNLPAAPTGTIMLSLVPLICGYILIVLAILIDVIFSPDILAYDESEEFENEPVKPSQNAKF